MHESLANDCRDCKGSLCRFRLTLSLKATKRKLDALYTFLLFFTLLSQVLLQCTSLASDVDAGGGDGCSNGPSSLLPRPIIHAHTLMNKLAAVVTSSAFFPVRRPHVLSTLSLSLFRSRLQHMKMTFCRSLSPCVPVCCIAMSTTRHRLLPAVTYQENPCARFRAADQE